MPAVMNRSCGRSSTACRKHPRRSCAWNSKSLSSWLTWPACKWSKSTTWSRRRAMCCNCGTMKKTRCKASWKRWSNPFPDCSKKSTRTKPPFVKPRSRRPISWRSMPNSIRRLHGTRRKRNAIMRLFPAPANCRKNVRASSRDTGKTRDMPTWLRPITAQTRTNVRASCGISIRGSRSYATITRTAAMN